MGSRVVYRGDEGVVPRAIDEEGIILRLRAISTEHNPPKLPFDDTHLDLVGKVAKVRRLSHAQRIRILGLRPGMIGSTSKHAAKHSVRRGTLGPIVGVVPQ